MQNPFTNKNLRSIYDPASAKWWFSAVDICAMLIDSDYETGRLYWNHFKYSILDRENRLIEKFDQVKLPTKNGRYRFTDVLDTKGVAYIIQIIPSPKAEPYRQWIAELIASGTVLETELVQLGASRTEEILEQYEKRPDKLHERLTATRRRLV